MPVMIRLNRKLVQLVVSSSNRQRLLPHPTHILHQSSSSSFSLYSTTTRKYPQRKPKTEPPLPSSSSPSSSPLSSSKSLRGSSFVAVQQEKVAAQRERDEVEPGDETAWPKPSEIPWQAKVANAVNLIGHVQMPVQFEASPDGKYWAGTVITQDGTSMSPQFWIPVIFEGDLAHIAACHLKEKDHVYIAGQLSADPPPFSINQGQANVQVLVRSINFVQQSLQMKKISAPYEQKDRAVKYSGLASIELEVDQGTTSWPAVGGIAKQPEAEGKIHAGVKSNGNPMMNPWEDLLNNPQEWRDNRKGKKNGSLNPKFPDFKRKDGSASVWLNRAPVWVLSKLEGLEFDYEIKKTKQEFYHPIKKTKQVKEHKGEIFWKDLVENPNKWWDNRSTKTNAKAPDFKHKDTGEALWLSSSPAWVLPKLPPTKSKQKAAIGEIHY